MTIMYANDLIYDIIATDEEIVQFFKDHERLCDCCKYYMRSCIGGATPGPHGPLYPLCTDIDPVENPSQFLKEDVFELMKQIITEEERNERNEP